MQTRNTLMLTTAAIGLAASGSSAQAADSYVSLFGGASLLDTPKMQGTSIAKTSYYAATSHQSIDTSYKTGFVVGANWGLDWGGLRTELELAYRGNNSHRTAKLKTSYSIKLVAYSYTYNKTPKTSTVKSQLTLNAFSLMANAWYDFHDLEFAGITPYAGAGIGFANVQLSGKLAQTSSGDLEKLYRRDQDVFAWQLGAGLSIPLADQFKAYVDYRYFVANDVSVRLEPGYNGGDVKFNYDDHTVLVGIRYTF